MGKIQDITGQRFGRLVVVSIFGKDKWRNTLWVCSCDCGNTIKVLSNNLIRLHTKSCGCFKKEVLKIKATTHGFGKQKIYSIFHGIIKRCNNSNTKCFYRYGGRGIKCEWVSFEEFRDDMLESYNLHVQEFGEKDTTIDRIDSNGNYSKENCRWATLIQQARNKRNTHFLKYKGNTKTLIEFSNEFDIPYEALRRRIVNKKWSTEKALTTPVKKSI
jgi:hypothetical protein